MLFLASVCLFCALVPALMSLVNLSFFRRTAVASSVREKVSVCIPARNEAANIRGILDGVLKSGPCIHEVLVGDDSSEDNTAALVAEVARSDTRVKLVPIHRLEEGWSGKQHALWRLAQQATGEVLVFVDADVRLGPDALPRLVEERRERGVDLLSGFPRQLTHTVGEFLLIPHIQFILLGFLPFFLAKKTNKPEFAAGCGQLFIVRRDTYFKAGGHENIRNSAHDGIHLPRAFRKKGFTTDVCDASDCVECRMYEGFAATWRGLGKNAVDGMASPKAIGPFTFFLVMGQVVPVLLVIASHTSEAASSSYAVNLLKAAVLAAGFTHINLAFRFGQSLKSALLFPVGIATLVTLQWVSLFRHSRRQKTLWKGRLV